MAAETLEHPAAPEAAAQPQTAEKTVEKSAPEAEKSTSEAEKSAPEAQDTKAEAEAEAEAKKAEAEVEAEVEAVAVVVDPEVKALEELKALVAAALANNGFSPPPPPPAEEVKAKAEDEPKAASGDAEAPAPPPPEVAPEPETEAKAEAKAETEAKAEEKAEAKAEEKADTETVPQCQPSTETESKPVAAEAEAEPVEEAKKEPEEVFIWGVPLVGDERSDTVLLKFLRARELKAKEAFEMLKNTILWRKEFGIDALVEEDLGLQELERTVFMCGVDKEGHPVCYNVFGEFQNLELYEKAFGDAEKRQRFLKWRIQYLEKGIRESLDFGPGGVCEMVQVTDLKNSPWRGKHRQVMNQAVTLLQDNYPEFIAKKVFINVPWWNLAYYRMMSSVFTPRTKSKFVFAGPSKSAETLFKYIAPEQVPVAFGGLSKENDTDFTTADVVTEVTIKPTSKHSVEIPATESSVLTWELRVLGWEVTYGAEFVPSAEEGYTVIVQKSRKVIATDEPVIKTSFKIGEPGKIVLNFENPTSKKKKMLYRFKVKSSTEST